MAGWFLLWLQRLFGVVGEQPSEGKVYRAHGAVSFDVTYTTTEPPAVAAVVFGVLNETTCVVLAMVNSLPEYDCINGVVATAFKYRVSQVRGRPSVLMTEYAPNGGLPCENARYLGYFYAGVPSEIAQTIIMRNAPPVIDEICPLCLGDLQGAEEGDVIAPCVQDNHQFHRRCIERVTNMKCPICKGEIPSPYRMGMMSACPPALSPGPPVGGRRRGICHPRRRRITKRIKRRRRG